VGILVTRQAGLVEAQVGVFLGFELWVLDEFRLVTGFAFFFFMGPLQ
jgi:hypothetical protein